MDLNINNLPETITVDVYPSVHANYGFFTVWSGSVCESYIPIGEPVSVTFTLSPSNTAMQSAVDALRAEQQEIRAKSERQCMELENKIQSLLALESDNG